MQAQYGAQYIEWLNVTGQVCLSGPALCRGPSQPPSQPAHTRATWRGLSVTPARTLS